MINIDHHNRCLGCMEEKGAAQTCPHCGLPANAAPESTLHLPPGTILQGKYLLGRALGQGGFGITYLAWDTNLNQKLAIKEYLPQQFAYRTGEDLAVSFYKSSSAVEFKYGLDRFLEEAQTLARFNEHPNIVTVHDYFEANNTAYLVMNYLEGVTLHSYLENKGGKISVEQALSIFMPVLDALKEVHAAGILHRDISPDNLLIDKNGRVILIDFGAARQAMGEKSKSLSVIMKAGYSPPEQYQSRGKQGPWTDIYAVAATIYRAITGNVPAEALERVMEDNFEKPTALGIKLDSQFEKGLLKALAVKAEERYQAVVEFQQIFLIDLPENKDEALAAGKAGNDTDKYEESIRKDKIINKAKLENGHKARSLNRSNLNGLPINSHPMRGMLIQAEVTSTARKKQFKSATAIILCGLLVIAGISLFVTSILDNDGETELGKLREGFTSKNGSVTSQVAPYLDPEKFNSTISAKIDADYYIDYENGTIPISSLPIGTRVVDLSWDWEFRIGENYTGSGEIKPVIWLIVDINHYEDPEPYVTLLSEEIIGLYTFDNSTDRGNQFGSSDWGTSGTTNALNGLRPWLNSSGIHGEEGFFMNFSDDFKQALLNTTIKNTGRKDNSVLTTSDKVFIPFATQLGYAENLGADQVSTAFSYFQETDKAKRVAKIDGENYYYWTCSPVANYDFVLYSINVTGDTSSFAVNIPYNGVRPALNMKANTLVSAIR